MIEIEEIRQQLRIDEVDVSDELLTRYLGAAIRLIENRTNRKLFKAEIPPGSPENALVLDDDLALAVLLLIAHWDENRGAATEGRQAEIPMGVTHIIGMYRWFYD